MAPDRKERESSDEYFFELFTAEKAELTVELEYEVTSWREVCTTSFSFSPSFLEVERPYTMPPCLMVAPAPISCSGDHQ